MMRNLCFRHETEGEMTRDDTKIEAWLLGNEIGFLGHKAANIEKMESAVKSQLSEKYAVI